jgi:hypothetical protein
VVLRGDSCDGGAGVDGWERDDGPGESVVFDGGERIQGLRLITVFFFWRLDDFIGSCWEIYLMV